jgi:hypothetical protein
VDVEQARDNSLLVSDDMVGAVYRISYNSSFPAAVAALAPVQVPVAEMGPLGT